MSHPGGGRLWMWRDEDDQNHRRWCSNSLYICFPSSLEESVVLRCSWRPFETRRSLVRRIHFWATNPWFLWFLSGLTADSPQTNVPTWRLQLCAQAWPHCSLSQWGPSNCPRDGGVKSSTLLRYDINFAILRYNIKFGILFRIIHKKVIYLRSSRLRQIVVAPKLCRFVVSHCGWAFRVTRKMRKYVAVPSLPFFAAVRTAPVVVDAFDACNMLQAWCKWLRSAAW